MIHGTVPVTSRTRITVYAVQKTNLKWRVYPESGVKQNMIQQRPKQRTLSWLRKQKPNVDLGKLLKKRQLTVTEHDKFLQCIVVGKCVKRHDVRPQFFRYRPYYDRTYTIDNRIKFIAAFAKTLTFQV